MDELLKKIDNAEKDLLITALKEAILCLEYLSDEHGNEDAENGLAIIERIIG